MSPLANELLLALKKLRPGESIGSNKLILAKLTALSRDELKEYILSNARLASLILTVLTPPSEKHTDDGYLAAMIVQHAFSGDYEDVWLNENWEDIQKKLKRDECNLPAPSTRSLRD